MSTRRKIDYTSEFITFGKVGWVIKGSGGNGGVFGKPPPPPLGVTCVPLAERLTSALNDIVLWGQKGDESGRSLDEGVFEYL